MSNATTPSQAKQLYQEPRQKLCEKVKLNVSSFGAVATSMVNGRAQHQPLTLAIQSFVAQERHIEDSYENLKKMALLPIHMTYQFEAIEKMSTKIMSSKENASNPLKKGPNTQSARKEPSKSRNSMASLNSQSTARSSGYEADGEMSKSHLPRKHVKRMGKKERDKTRPQQTQNLSTSSSSQNHRHEQSGSPSQ